MGNTGHIRGEVQVWKFVRNRESKSMSQEKNMSSNVVYHWKMREINYQYWMIIGIKTVYQ